jgi:hypothetical protein
MELHLRALKAYMLWLTNHCIRKTKV